MKQTELASLHTWLIEPMDAAVVQAIERLRRAPDVAHVAVMPDVHLATEVCVGTVFGTSQLIYPQAVGGDIGCGMLAMAFDRSADCLAEPTRAGNVLAAIGKAVPSARRHRRATLPQPTMQAELSIGYLESLHREEGNLQFGTLGGGNHFIELQADAEDQLWLMIHSGSRVMGQAIRAHHMARAESVGSGFKVLDSDSPAGKAYLQDVAWARSYAHANRAAMAEQVATVLQSLCGAKLIVDTLVDVDHNHVVLEDHCGKRLWVHRKGTMPAADGRSGILPGSMGTLSFHVEGRGCEASLQSSAHGAGRALSREAARKSISQRDLHRQMEKVWHDYRLGNILREEAPSAYKDIRAVLRAQRDLVKVVRTLRPILNYKGR